MNLQDYRNLKRIENVLARVRSYLPGYITLAAGAGRPDLEEDVRKLMDEVNKALAEFRI